MIYQYGLTTLLARPLAGRAADYRGGRGTAMVGMMLSAVCCLGGVAIGGAVMTGAE